MNNREFGELHLIEIVSSDSEAVPATVIEKTVPLICHCLQMGRREGGTESALKPGDLPEIYSSIIFEGKD